MNAANSKRSTRAQADPGTIDLVSHSSLHTERLGERLAAHAEPGTVVALWGELGAGKTVLARGIAIGLGIDEESVTSPTFIILREHLGGRLPMYHLDLYRLEASQLGSTGWEEAIDAGGVTVIEWPDRAGDLLPPDRVDVRLEHVAETKRTVTIEPTGPRSRRIVDALRDDAFGDKTA
ncbi:MAG TPA: tRNA (adenosine(37)-N6)-threonylcarbamoyltransferase complex ATPase subunit type 1 TsaE [Candidatus Saccharimonadales bacterium]|nr:tRNA (adenosine(37)-N6)-threonylcarbamoyltransferase complex ATPase subunit type 1 TsaE [Candidatus Saccharimonadales bacterium]